MKVTEDTVQTPKKLKPKEKHEYIEDLIFDFHDGVLYYSDSGNNRIGKLVFDRSKNMQWKHESFLNVTGEVSGLEIDSCQRNLYYTIVSKNEQSINVVSLDQKEPKILKFGEKQHSSPVAMALDHQQRRLYVADVEQYNSYSIDSIIANGSDFRNEISEHGNVPRSIGVDSQFVYFVEANGKALKRFRKNSNEKSSQVFKQMTLPPFDLIVRQNFITDLDPAKCKLSADRIDDVKKAIEQNALKTEQPSKMCLHGGSLDKSSSSCNCMENFDGEYCEINLCYNFCFNGGECSMNRNQETLKLEPTCSCKREYNGKHCELDICHDFCLNNGKCSVTAGKKAQCSCSDQFTGARCENLKAESSAAIIKSRKDAKKLTETTTSTPEETSNAKVPESSSELIGERDLNCEPNNVKQSYVILAVCFTVSLLIFLITLVVVKKMNKQLRPKIRKKYVVHKNIEPLTSRPMTEQCEVIIEDCCNMNICETVRPYCTAPN